MTIAAMQPILSLRDVSKAFGGIQAVEACTFDVAPQLITGLIGPNGAGKTTIFNLITGFLRADKGAIRYKGEVGCPTPLGENVLTLFLRPGQVRAEEAAARERAMQALAFFGLDGRAHELAEDLAYPEQKLLSMARMLATDAELLLLDEPTSGLDADSLARIVPVVRRLVERGKTVLLIEHNMELISQLSDEVVFLHQGRVLARGKPAQITRDPSLTEIYFGV
jgi:ABC-type branched-subunit amino acid transport system ATPase component